MSNKYDLNDYYDDEYELEDEEYYAEMEMKKKNVIKKNPPVVNNKNTITNKTTVSNSKTNTNQNKTNTNTNISNHNTKDSNQISLVHSKSNKKDTCQFISIENANKEYIIPQKEIKINFKPTLNLVTIGHVDAGKSTLLGHFLFQLGQVSDRQLVKYEKESKLMGKSTFHFAWALDEDLEERKRGVTVDIAYKTVETEKYFINLMDAPGHRDFVPNMISGTAQADAALLIIDSSPTSFESGFYSGGQTREHAILALALGVKQIIVVINKMEVTSWSAERYNYITSTIHGFLQTIGFQDKSIKFIPVSGLIGTNLTKVNPEDKLNKWYGIESLLDIINSLEEPVRLYNHPTRFLITDISKGVVNNRQGCEIFGKLLGGTLETNKEYGIYPLGITTTVKTMKCQNNEEKIIYAGDNAELIIDTDDNTMENLRQGMIISELARPVPVITSFTLEMMTLSTNEAPLTIGQVLIIHSKLDKSNGKISKIHLITQGDKSKKNSPIIPKNHFATVDITLEKPICLEINSNFNALSRITLRDEGKTVACGVVKKLLK